jgi:molybdopterin-guanine dinucleotide biosynthesis protein A
MILGLVLAGGASSRFGAEKAVAAHNGGILMDAALEALSAACADVAISAKAESGASYLADSRGHLCLADPPDAPSGPLSGVLAGLQWAASLGADQLATAPCDVPELSAAQVRSLADAAGDGAACARSSRGLEPLIAVWPVRASLAIIAPALGSGDHPSIRDILATIGFTAVDGFEGPNVNTPGDLPPDNPSPVPPEAHLFGFEDDFVRTLRCVPMCVRLKLDRTGVKLSLRQWSRFTREDREALRLRPCATPAEIAAYRDALVDLIAQRSSEPVAMLSRSPEPVWERSELPDEIPRFAATRGVAAPAPDDWAKLVPLQRYALVKLTRDKHENANFEPAMREFGLLD